MFMKYYTINISKMVVDVNKKEHDDNVKLNKVTIVMVIINYSKYDVFSHM